MRWPVGFMVWRIGDLVDVTAQFDWVRGAGFDAVSFHASPGVSGEWQGVDPGATGPAERHRLRQRLDAFAMREVHAPFDAALVGDRPQDGVDQLRPTIEFAGDVGADIVTVHATPPRDQPDRAWRTAIDRLDELAGRAGVTVGLEITDGFAFLDAPRRQRIGVTLDIGHFCADASARQRHGPIGRVVRMLGGLLVHVHVHDQDGTVDHIEPGTGRIDFDEVLGGLADIGYGGALCLELNPDRVSPDGIRRSAAFLRDRMDARTRPGGRG